jgi:protein gp37
MSVSKIEWTDVTWNPVRGCSRVSPGCVNCYAERMAARFAGSGEPFDGFAAMVGEKHGTLRGRYRHVAGTPRWTGRVELIPEKLDEPLHWKKPRRVFVNSMSDLFHEALSDEQIAAVFGIMATSPMHTFQILTKRAGRMQSWFDTMGLMDSASSGLRCAIKTFTGRSFGPRDLWPWPLPNVHLGVSCEEQQRLDERVPLLLQTPAAVRSVSLEPLLGPVDLSSYLDPLSHLDSTYRKQVALGMFNEDQVGSLKRPRLDWVIVGGESGPGARPCDVSWIRSILRQCREAGVPCFVKQLGARPFDSSAVHLPVDALLIRHPKGGNPQEWPEDLRVREFPR